MPRVNDALAPKPCLTPRPLSDKGFVGGITTEHLLSLRFQLKPVQKNSHTKIENDMIYS